MQRLAATDKKHLLSLLRQFFGNIPPARGALQCVCRVVQVVHPLALFLVGVGNVFVRLSMGTQPPNKYVNRTLRRQRCFVHSLSFR